MKYLVQRLLLFAALSLTTNAWAQLGKLSIDIDPNYLDSDCLMLTVTQENDTLTARTITNLDLFEEEDIVIDSLRPGMYLLSIRNCGEVSDEQFHFVSSYVEIQPEKVAQQSFYLGQTVRYMDVDREEQREVVDSRSEFQATFSYFDFRWNPDGNNPKFNAGIAGSGYSWFSFSKHVGFLMGGGFGWSLAQLQIDQQTSADYPDEVKSNYYNYVYLEYDAKFRFSLLNQQAPEISKANLFLDIGAQYNLPLYFARITRFSIQDKLVNRFIHRFSDVRLFASLGVANFQVFAYYRPFDFINENLPQFPKFNLGVKLNFHD